MREKGKIQTVYKCPNQRRARKIKCMYYQRGKCTRTTWRNVDAETNLPFCEYVNAHVIEVEKRRR